jgi:hypothetical protein
VLRHDRIAVWQTLEHLRTVLVDQWIGLSRNEKFVAAAIAVPLLFYLAKNSDSYVVNTVSALTLFVIMAYLIMILLSPG